MKRPFTPHALLLSLAIILGTTASSLANWQQLVTPFVNRSHKKLPPTKLVYDLNWNGMVSAGILTFEFNKKDKRYPGVDVTQAYGRSIGPAFALFPYSFNFTCFAKSKTSKPIVFVASEKDDKESETTENRFNGRGVAHQSTETNLRTKAQERKKYLFRHANTHSVTSLMKFLRRQPLNNGDVIHAAILPFDSTMFGRFTVLGREVHRGQRAIKLKTELFKIDRKSMQLKQYKKLKGAATIWISDDANRYMTELRAKIIFGDVRAVLTKVEAL